MSTTKLIDNLANPAIYDHPIEYFKTLQTHISWILLTGDYVYKIKKPFDFEFLNFTTLEKRKFYCEEELRLNKLLAPEIYLDVVAITGSEEYPQINGEGPIIEYAIKMREFSQENLLNRLLEKDKLTTKHISDAAKVLADLHQKADKNGPDYLGTVEQIHEPVLQNFDQIRSFLTKKDDLQQLDKLAHWANSQYEHWHEVFKQRKQEGFIRECHGDVHLGNITLYNDQTILFDRIEFNESFRWTDVMADVGFMAMDLDDHQKPDYANRFINTYISITGDYHGLQILPYYRAYRAVVRAKVSLFEMAGIDDAEKKQACYQQYKRFAALAETYATPQKNKLFITHGLSGSGKSTAAKLLVNKFGCIQLRSDIERKRLAGLSSTADSNSGLYQDLYAPAVTEKLYQHLADLTKLLLQANCNVIVDATFLKKTQRTLFAVLANQLQIPLQIVYCNISLDDALLLLEKRNQLCTEPSEASEEVLKIQYQTIEPLDENERQKAILINLQNVNNFEMMLKQIEEKMAGLESTA